MNKEQVILQLKSLKRDAETRIDKDDENDIFKADFKALNYAINILENIKE